MDQQTLLIMLIIPGALVALLAAVFWFVKSPAKARLERRRSMRRLAERLDMHYLGMAQSDEISYLPPLQILPAHEVVQIYNLMGERRRPPRLVLFDLTYHTAGGRRVTGGYEAPIYLVAMAALPSGQVSAPVRVYQDDWFGGPVGVEEAYRLEFREDPVFSTRYMVHGGPEDRVRALLAEQVRSALKGWKQKGPKPVVEMLPGWVVVYVESDIYDGDAEARAEATLSYACAIARSLGSG